MRENLRILTAATGLLTLLLTAPAMGENLNKSVKIHAGEASDGASSINGSISVGAGAIVSGSVDTVNGSIRIDDNAQVQDAQTVNGSVKVGDGVSSGDLTSVNGSITIRSGATIDGEVSVVNGKISMQKGTTVSRDVSNVNGAITIEGAQIGGSLTTVNGDVRLDDGATLQGDLTIEDPKSWNSKEKQRKPKIVIGPGSRVLGNIVVEREVELFISDSAEVGGVSGIMSMADAVRFSGSRP